ncbi:hypothetical protein AKJ09_01766 [Labilithrix luteola]|uniref:Tetratricopeptide repeat protein n=1 Tax=Labilithrix luteola TaxID=1391654 RepID=A0A0K1PNL0_9BACT|nr:hypothetical protein AKJ09_01766 [Labilithrix luteola]
MLQLAKLQRKATSDPAQAIDLALAGHAEFPHGVLFQEREVILVDALVQAGRLSEAKKHARAFVEAYPKSPVISHLRAIAEIDAP